MSFTKEDKEYLDKLIKTNVKSNNDKIFEGVDQLVDYKIQTATEDIDRKASRRHSDLLNHFDEILKEIRDNREERTTQAHHIIRNTKRIEKLEKAVFKN